MALFLARDLNVYLEDDLEAHKILIQSDFRYTRAGRMNIVSRETMYPTGDRSVLPVIEEVGPINFSFSTYAQFDDTDVNMTSAQRILWKSLAGTESALSETPALFTTTFGDSADVPTLTPFSIYIEHRGAGKVIKLTNAVIDRMSINLNIKAIANITWSGTALGYESGAALPTVDKDYSTAMTECITPHNMSMDCQRNSIWYQKLFLTSGKIEVNNNNVYYKQKRINQAHSTIGHYTGSRVISGDLEFYLRSGADETFDLLDTIQTDANTDISTSTSSDLEDNIGDILLQFGDSNYRFLTFYIPILVFNLPEINFRELMKVRLPFVAKESATSPKVLMKYEDATV
jgi:hypothetical protein